MMEFGVLKVSTMTWTAAIAGSINLDTIFTEIVLSGPEDDEGIVELLDKERSASRPPGLVLGKKFGCNVTMRVRVKKDDKLVNIKLFSNGCLQLTGAKTAEDAASVCRIVADKLFSAQQAEQSTYFDLRVRMINSDMRTSHGIKRAHLYEVWRADPKACIVYDPITYPALKVILFYDSTIPLADQDGFCTCSKHCSTKQNAKYRKCVKVTVALFESGCIIITGSIMPEDAQVVRQYIIDKLKAEGEKAYITKEDPKVIMARIVQRYRASQSAA
jgi:TATA-box binding protein (TBP) (component of TFIID and TFIIIB)